MRYELTDYEWAAIKPFLPNKPRGVPRVPPRAQRHLLGRAFRCAVARSAGELWTLYNLLQSLHSLATGGRLGWDYERASCDA